MYTTTDLKKLLFTNYKENTSQSFTHQLNEFDVLRGLAVLFMIMIHVQITFGSIKMQSSALGLFIDFLGSPPAAPVFMTTMGVFFIISKGTDTTKAAIKRGIKLLIFASAFSFLREDLLMILEGEFLYQNAMFIHEVDILQFAGWAFIFMAIIRHFFKKPVSWLIISLAITFVSPFLWSISSSIAVLNWFFNILFATGKDAYFPIFPWLVYPLVGMTLGTMLKSRAANPGPVFSFIKRLGLGLMIFGFLIYLTNPDFHYGDYYHCGPGGVVAITGFVLLWTFIVRNITYKYPKSKMIKWLSELGTKTTTIYVVHWLLISWGSFFVGYQVFGFVGIFALMAFYIIISKFISRYITIQIK